MNNKRLCDRCLHGMVIRGDNLGEEEVVCTSVFKLITFDVTDCNRYVQKDTLVAVETAQSKWVM